MRNPVFDIMKFIAIMGVIVAHCVHDWRQPLVYICTLQLFFFVGGYFFKPKSIANALKYEAQRLLIPYLIGGVGISIILTCLYINNQNFNLWDRISPLFTGGGAFLNNHYGFMLWFFSALFVCSIIYTIVNRYIKGYIYSTLVIIAITIIGYYLSIYYIRVIPFLIPQACAAIIFFHSGYMFKTYNSITPKSHAIIWWILAIVFATILYNIGPCDIFTGLYRMFPLYILGSLGGIFIVSQLSYYCCILTPKIANILAQLGSISILIYLVHFLEFTVGGSHYITSKLLFFIDNYEQTILEKILFALIVSLLLYQIPIVRRVFRLSKPQYIDIKTLKS